MPEISRGMENVCDGSRSVSFCVCACIVLVGDLMERTCKLLSFLFSLGPSPSPCSIALYLISPSREGKVSEFLRNVEFSVPRSPGGCW